MRILHIEYQVYIILHRIYVDKHKVRLVYYQVIPHTDTEIKSQSNGTGKMDDLGLGLTGWLNG